MLRARWLSWIAPLAAAVALTVPALQVAAEPVVIIQAAPPAAPDAYPSYVYEGRPVYDVDGRFYYRDGRDWAYYREPPAHLWRMRTARMAARRAAWRREARRSEWRRELRDAGRDRYGERHDWRHHR